LPARENEDKDKSRKKEKSANRILLRASSIISPQSRQALPQEEFLKQGL
jgi:hypothetical protein